MKKYTREDAEKQEIVGLLDALCDGAIELNEEFLNRFTGKDVKDLLLLIPEKDRSYFLSSAIDEENCFFNGSPAQCCDNDIWINTAEIEVQFEGSPEDYFENPDDWYIGGDLAYHTVGYGLTIEVDIDRLKEDIDEALQGN